MIDRTTVILYAVTCAIAGAVYAGALAIALYLGRDMSTASKIALAAGGGVLTMLSHGVATWAQSPKRTARATDVQIPIEHEEPKSP